MMLGCCHCGEADSQSNTLSDDAGSVLFNSSDIQYISCGVCSVIPVSWIVTLSGWTSPYPAHASCCDGINGRYRLHGRPLSESPGGGGGSTEFTLCAYWRSGARATSQITATGVAPTCADVSTIAKVQVLLFGDTAGPDKKYKVTVRTVTSPNSIWVFETANLTGIQCVFPPATPWAFGSGNRCDYGTVTLEPG